MNGKQLRAILAELRFSQLELGRLMGVDGRTVRRWIADEVTIPACVTILLLLLKRKKITADDIRGCWK
jgi:transcriptional regulator with XRE-family HTH domain